MYLWIWQANQTHTEKLIKTDLDRIRFFNYQKVS